MNSPDRAPAPLIVVTGATGNIGRCLVDRLLADGAAVRALTRDPARAALPAGAETVRADLTGAQDLAPLLAGADALFLNLAAGGGQAVTALVDAAVAAGVRRIVLNSSMAVTDTAADDSNHIARMHADVERTVRDSGLEWTFVRGSNYSTNTLAWARRSVRPVSSARHTPAPRARPCTRPTSPMSPRWPCWTAAARIWARRIAPPARRC